MLKYMTIEDSCKAVGGSWQGDKEKLKERVCEVVTDSRKIKAGTLFVALTGERVDGHDYIGQVLEAGAICAISEKKLEDSIKDYILVADTRKALRDLAAYYRSILDIKVVGITGSVGKTSTKEMISKVLEEHYKVQKTAGNFNNEIGVPLTVFTITEEHEIAVTEMGISDFGEMSRLSQITRPDIMVITNIGQCHLENLGTRDGILKAKTECFDYLNPGARVVLNGNDDKLSTVDSVQNKAPYFFGVDTSDELFVTASNIKSLGLAGSEADIKIGEEIRRITIPIAGIHMVSNACAAAAVATLLGMTFDEIEAGISKCSAVAGRGKLIKTENYLLVDDCYNANPVSMKAELDLLEQSDGRRVAILGDMFELGENEQKMHYDLGEYAVAKCDVLICIGKLSKNMADGANSAADVQKCECFYFENKESFIADREDILKKGDTILLKASHGMAFGELLDILAQ